MLAQDDNKNNSPKLISALTEEASRIEEDCLYSMKGHFNAGSRWQKVHIGLGLPSTILAGWAGIEAFANNLELTALLALLSAALTATITFLSPQKLAENHKSSGREFNVLRNKARRFKSIDVLSTNTSELPQTLNEMADKKDSLNSMSLDIPRWAYNKAKQDIEAGQNIYKVDKEATSDSK